MLINQLPDNHFSLESAGKIKDVCKPFFENSVVNFFIYLKYRANGELICLTSNPEWHQYFWNMGYQNKCNIRLAEGSLFWGGDENLTQAFIEAKEKFNIDNKFEITRKFDNSYETLGFGTSKDCSAQKALSYYMNNQDHLHQFALSFKNQSKKLIDACVSDKNKRLKVSGVMPCFSNKEESAYYACKLDKFSLNVNGTDVYLSLQEARCLKYTLKLFSSKDISDIMGISAKTVESNIERVKAKLNCLSRSELFECVYASGMFDVLINNKAIP